ncbi:hypothetical protein SOVF_059460 [Spinacia oleracea]|nr:hypothetical protein SOVF_059460 [Spinacia oleracea]
MLCSTSPLMNLSIISLLKVFNGHNGVIDKAVQFPSHAPVGGLLDLPFDPSTINYGMCTSYIFQYSIATSA